MRPRRPVSGRSSFSETTAVAPAAVQTKFPARAGEPGTAAGLPHLRSAGAAAGCASGRGRAQQGAWAGLCQDGSGKQAGVGSRRNEADAGPGDLTMARAGIGTLPSSPPHPGCGHSDEALDS